MTLKELWDRYNADAKDMEIMFDMNGDGAVLARDATIATIDGEDEHRLVLTNVEGMFDDGY